jgi:hypothetical protein|tara:strand:- start:13078 stop:13515 length:438 start_codon:yes stop_codon:yes gene_type:complete
MFKKLLITFLSIVFFSITSHCFAGDKNPLYQSKTSKECIKESGVDMSWIEVINTRTYTHYINREVEHAVVHNKLEKIIFIIKGLKEVYIICGQEYPDKTQTWLLYEIDINEFDDSFTKLYKTMLEELVEYFNSDSEPETKCIIND